MLFTRGGQTKKCGGWITLDGLLLKGFGVVARLLRCARNDGVTGGYWGLLRCARNVGKMQ